MHGRLLLSMFLADNKYFMCRTPIHPDRLREPVSRKRSSPIMCKPSFTAKRPEERNECQYKILLYRMVKQLMSANFSTAIHGRLRIRQFGKKVIENGIPVAGIGFPDEMARLIVSPMAVVRQEGAVDQSGRDPLWIQKPCDGGHVPDLLSPGKVIRMIR